MKTTPLSSHILIVLLLLPLLIVGCNTSPNSHMAQPPDTPQPPNTPMPAVPAAAQMAYTPRPPATLDELTERQTEVLALIAKGHKNRDIAQELHISNSTVKNEIARVKEKLSLNSRAELAAYAQQRGLLD